ncbi:conjugative transposon protein TraN [Chitinophaga pollutisoli]|uniref:Conjugative transposon protein TraN n=1 Tax=Chitinophaga pollutisoli TaxID=3133966 RepID=A0ABZ2YN20_9BACT|nr:conjugative transposon protein TraN [Chitinophaga rhizosphaerae]
MKQCIILPLLFLLTLGNASAQMVELPSSTAITPYSLSVGYNKTTVLIFPAPIKDADRGRQDIIVSRQAGVGNVLKVKAARMDFEPSNLHVFTADGKLYSFEISFGAGSGGTFDLSRLAASTGRVAQHMPLIFPEMEEGMPDTQLRLCKVEAGQPFFRKTARKHQLRLRLLSIHFDQDRLYFRYRIWNKSSLPYFIDFTRMYISDGRQVKRATAQQQELAPDITAGSKMVPGHSTAELVFVVKRFTIPKGKKFQFEIYEKDGGRNIQMEVRNRHLFKARPLL